MTAGFRDGWLAAQTYPRITGYGTMVSVTFRQQYAHGGVTAPLLQADEQRLCSDGRRLIPVWLQSPISRRHGVIIDKEINKTLGERVRIIGTTSRRMWPGTVP